MTIYLKVSQKTREARRLLESIGKPKGKELLKKFLNNELKNKLISKTSAQSVINYIENSNDSNITEFAKLLQYDENREKFKKAVKCQAKSTGTKKNGLFYKLIYQNGNLNMESLNKSKIKAFLLAKKDTDIIEENEDKIENEDKKSRRMKNEDIIEKLKSGRLSNILKVFMALVLWKYLKLLASGDIVAKSSDEAKKAKKEEKIELNFELNINNCQVAHETEIPKGQGDARFEGRYGTKLLRDHLNEALKKNKQGVAFNNKFFEDYEVSEWRTENQGVYEYVGEEILEEVFEKSDFLKSLKLNDNTTLENYIFGMLQDNEAVSRIQSLKIKSPKIYYTLYDELMWITNNEDFLKKEDKSGMGELYQDRLKIIAEGLNNECSTELRSLIESWSVVIDQLSQEQKNKVSNEVDVTSVRKKILTNVRIRCLEDLAESLAMEATPEDTTAIRPEIQEIIRYQCADALNIPERDMDKDHLEFLKEKYDLVYKTNVLSSIMNIRTIASQATEYIQSFGNNSKLILEQFDDKMSYSICCKILDKSSRMKLKNDRRSFDERFRDFMKKKENEFEEEDIELLNNWVKKGRKEKIDDIFGIAVIFFGEEAQNLLPECFFSMEERFGYLIFIKYLVDQEIIKLL